MSDRKTLDLAREWAKRKLLNPVNDEDAVRAALLIQSLPDTIVDGDKLWEVIEEMRASLEAVSLDEFARGHDIATKRWRESLEALLPAVPRTMAEIEWDDDEHHLAEVETPAGLVLAMVSPDTNEDGEEIVWCAALAGPRNAGSYHADLLTPTGRKYHLEPQDDTPAPSIEDKTAPEPASRREELTWKLQALLPDPEPASPRPDGCCGACPETVGGGVDCTCADNPRCPNHQPRTLADMAPEERYECLLMQCETWANELAFLVGTDGPEGTAQVLSPKNGLLSRRLEDVIPRPDLPRMVWPTGKPEPEDDTPAPEPASPRPEDVPVGEVWKVEVDGNTAIGFRNEPWERWPWCVTYQVHPHTVWLGDNDVTLIARLVPETTEQDEEPEFGPAYLYTDRDGDEWEYIDGGWFTADTHAKRVAKRKHHSGLASLPAKYGPYTRNEDTK